MHTLSLDASSSSACFRYVPTYAHRTPSMSPAVPTIRIHSTAQAYPRPSAIMPYSQREREYPPVGQKYVVESVILLPDLFELPSIDHEIQQSFFFSASPLLAEGPPALVLPILVDEEGSLPFFLPSSASRVASLIFPSSLSKLRDGVCVVQINKAYISLFSFLQQIKGEREMKGWTYPFSARFRRDNKAACCSAAARFEIVRSSLVWLSFPSIPGCPIRVRDRTFPPPLGDCDSGLASVDSFVRVAEAEGGCRADEEEVVPEVLVAG